MFPYIILWKTRDRRVGSIWSQQHYLNKFGLGLLGNSTIYIQYIKAQGFAISDKKIQVFPILAYEYNL